MEMKDFTFKLEELQIKAEKVRAIEEAIYHAIYSRNDRTEAYEWAFVALDEMAFDLKEELQELINELFEYTKGEHHGKTSNL